MSKSLVAKRGAAIWSLLLLALSMHVPVAAEEAATASIAGDAVDAVGRPLADAPVTLFASAAGRPAGGPLQSSRTDPTGNWRFTGVEPGAYVVQLDVNGHVAGVPTFVGEGSIVNGLLIVSPSAALASVALAQDSDCVGDDCDDTGGLPAFVWILIAAGVGLGVTLPFLGDDDES